MTMYFSDEPFTCHDANCKDLGSRGPGGNVDLGTSTTIGTIGGDIYGGGPVDGPVYDYGGGYGGGYF